MGGFLRWMYWASFAGALASSVGCGADSEPIAGVELGIGGYPTSFNNAVDATISKSQPTTNFGSSSRCIVDGGSTERACAIRWDLSSISPTETVSGASIQLNITNGSTDTFVMYYLLRDWSESSLTWNQAVTGTPWGLPGAKATTDRGGPFGGVMPVATGTTVTIPFSPQALPIVQSWISNPASNRGITIVNASATDRLEIRSSEDGLVDYRPILRLTYSTGAGGSPG